MTMPIIRYPEIEEAISRNNQWLEAIKFELRESKFILERIAFSLEQLVKLRQDKERESRSSVDPFL